MQDEQNFGATEDRTIKAGCHSAARAGAHADKLALIQAIMLFAASA
jgi:hypothetical protein